MSLRLSLSSLLLSIALCGPALAEEPWSLLAEDSYPNNYLDHGELKGRSVDLLREAFRQAGVPATFSVLPWSRAYDTALKTEHSCVFSTAHTPERDSSFAWVEPLSTIEMVVVGASHHPIVVKSDDELRKYTIGTYYGDYRESILKAMNMRIESVSNDELNAEKLRRGRVDLWATDTEHLSKMKGEFAPVYTFYKVNLALACNIRTDRAKIDTLRHVLESFHTDGTYERIMSAYSLD